MRIPIKEKRVRAGDLVRIRAEKGRANFAKISIWTKMGDGDFAPFVPDFDEGGLSKPQFLTPSMMTVSDRQPSADIAIEATENMDLRVVFEADWNNDTPPKIKVYRHGKIERAIRRFCRNAIGRLRGRYHTQTSIG